MKAGPCTEYTVHCARTGYQGFASLRWTFNYSAKSTGRPFGLPNHLVYNGQTS